MAAILGALSMMPFVATAQEQTVQLVGQIGGTCKAVEVVGNRAYVGEGVFLTVLDISNPTSPSRMGRIRLPDMVESICASTNTVYVVTSERVMQIIDVSNPFSPTLGGSLEDMSTCMSVSGEFLLARAYRDYRQFDVYDISNPSSPILRSSYNTAGGVSDVLVTGRRAYVSESNGLRIFDLSDPSSPSLLGTHPQWGNAVSVAGTMAYLVDGRRLFAVDISDPSSPVPQGSIPTREGFHLVTNGLVVAGTTVYTTWQDFTHLVNDLPVSGGLQAIDVTTPTQLRLLSTYDALGPAFGLAERAGLVFVADGYAGLTVVDARIPSDPHSLGARGNPGVAYDVVVSDNLAFVGNAFGVRIVDVADPSWPVLRGSYATQDDVYGVFVSGDLGYVTSSRWLKILDVTDPTSPTIRGSLQFDQNWYPLLLHSPVVIGDVLYVLGFFNGLAMVEVSDPSSPTLLALYPYGPSYYDIFYWGLSVSGGLAYVGRSDSELYSGDLDILDVSDPSSPVLLCSYDTREPARDVCVSGDLAFVTRYDNEGYDSGLLILDVSNPSSPTEIGFFEGAYDSVTVSGDMAYVTLIRQAYRYYPYYLTEIHVLEIADPRQPRLRGRYELPWFCGKVHVSDDLVYAPAIDAGLWILRYTPMPPAAPANLRADPLSWNEIYLRWADRSDFEDGFAIERKVGAGGTWQPLAVTPPYTSRGRTTPPPWPPPLPPPPHWYDRDTSPGVTYYYRVRAYNTVGYSDYSNETSATIALEIPNAPTNARVRQVFQYPVYNWTLSWHDNADNEEGFRIEWRVDGSTSWLLAATANPDVESLVIEYLPCVPDVTYFFQVRAFNPVGESQPSNEAWFTSATVVPAAPSDLSAGAVGPWQVNLSWQDNSVNETGFTVYRRIGTSGTLSSLGGVAPNRTTYQDTRVEPNTRYSYVVRAYNSQGYSDESNYANAQTPPLATAADSCWRRYE